MLTFLAISGLIVAAAALAEHRHNAARAVSRHALDSRQRGEA